MARYGEALAAGYEDASGDASVAAEMRTMVDTGKETGESPRDGGAEDGKGGGLEAGSQMAEAVGLQMVESADS